VTYTAPENVESLQAADGTVIDLTGNALDNTLVANDLGASLVGGSGRDTLIGGNGNDELDGGDGVDRMIGGQGDDLYYVDSRLDVIGEAANEGTDTVYAASNYILGPNIENLILEGTGDWVMGGNSLNNRLVGNSGDNLLAGGLGRDTLEGGLGDDVYVLTDTLDTIIDTGGTDTIRSILDIVLQADIENAELTGIGDTVAIGNAADNLIRGNSSDNILEGLLGVDTLTGGAGSDQFIIASNGSGVAVDQVTDFKSGEDLLVIDLVSFSIDLPSLGLASSGTVLSTSFIAGAGVQALDPSDHFLFDTARGVLRFDADGSGAAAPIDLVHFVGLLDSPLSGNDIYVAL
jgi:Ca2+-binding RTX toxin-like protein